jgi:hypothetical protein
MAMRANPSSTGSRLGTRVDIVAPPVVGRVAGCPLTLWLVPDTLPPCVVAETEPWQLAALGLI